MLIRPLPVTVPAPVHLGDGGLGGVEQELGVDAEGVRQGDILVEGGPGASGEPIRSQSEIDADGRVRGRAVSQDLAQAVTVDVERGARSNASKTSPVMAVITLLLMSFAAWADPSGPVCTIRPA